jgi:hypothetical protein
MKHGSDEEVRKLEGKTSIILKQMVKEQGVRTGIIFIWRRTATSGGIM